MLLIDTKFIFSLPLFYVLIYYFNKFLQNIRFRRFASANGCEALNHSASKLPWGIDRIHRMHKLTAEGGDVMAEVIMPSFTWNGNTFSSTGLLGEVNILTCDPENMKAIFATQFNDFPTGSRRSAAFGYMVGKCIFTTDGPFWEHSRALFKPHFSTGHFANLEITENAAQDMLKALEFGMQGDRTRVVDLQAMFLRFTLDTGTEFLFGTNVKSQLAAIPGALNDTDIDDITRAAADRAGDGMGFTEAFHVASVEVTKRAKLQSLYWLADSAKARSAVKYLQDFVDYLVDDTLKGKSEGKSKKKNTLLRALAEDTQDPIELRDQTLFMLTASRDTTAALLSWMYLMLAKYPTIFEKLRECILNDFGTEQNPEKITFNTLKQCRYLQWVMLETLRLYPPGPLNSRVAARDVVLPVGGGEDGKAPVAIRKGQTVMLCVYAMHRREDLWGADALEFRPERWEKRKLDWSFLPFSGGPRICLGRE